ncbi:ribosomal protection-like ABC-F family protein [Alloiococcus otitis]
MNHLSKSIADRNLFHLDHLSISDQDKVGLIGNNGAGKTSFLKILAGIDPDYEGQLEISTELIWLMNDETKDLDFSGETYSRAQLDPDESLSPGQYQRLKLTSLLKDQEAFLLIDEPTSHLDIDQKEKLASRLKARKKGYVMVSHDRDFINKTCNKIMELSAGKFELYNGNYQFYLEERLRRQKFKEREYDKYVKEKTRLENLTQEIEDQSANVRKTPNRMGNSEARLHKMGGQQNKKKLDKQAKAVQSRLNQLDVKEKPEKDQDIQLTIPEQDKIQSKTLIKSQELTKRFGQKVIFDQAKLEIANGRKWALIGDNGSGKTSLLQMILNKEVYVHPKLKIGYYSQLTSTLDLEKSVLANVEETSIYDETLTRIILARLTFKGDQVSKKVANLSDGEKAKVKLAKLVTGDFNFLMMDEPCNYLDIGTIEALESLLVNYDRPLLFVSHDVSFINKVATDLLLIEDQKIKTFPGNLAQYQKEKQKPSPDDESDLRLDFRLTSINNRLAAMELTSEEREELEKEFDRLMELKRSR